MNRNTYYIELSDNELAMLFHALNNLYSEDNLNRPYGMKTLIKSTKYQLIKASKTLEVPLTVLS